MTDISAECIAIDSMYLLNQNSPIPKYVKTGEDLANEFCKRVEKLTMNASLVVVAFDNYTKDIENVSLKTGTRVMRNEKKGGKGKPARHHEIRSDTNISKLKMSDLLAHSSQLPVLPSSDILSVCRPLFSSMHIFKSDETPGDDLTFATFNVRSPNS